MNDALLIQGDLREQSGTGPSRSLRLAGRVPAVVYGKGQELKLFSISQKEADALYNNFQIKSAIINVKIGDASHAVLPKEFSLHPVTDSVEHVDFIFVDQATSIQIKIPVRIKGAAKSIGIKKGGLVNLVFRALPCRVSKDNIPPYIEIDITEMDIGVILTLKDITLPEGVKLLSKDLNQTLLRLTGKRKVVEEVESKEPTAEGEAAADGAPAEGSAAKAGGDEKSAAPAAEAGKKKDKK